MTFAHIIGSIRLYGLQGCLEHFRRIANRAAEINKWNKYLIGDKRHIPTKGITIIGVLSGSWSVCKVLRDFCVNLKRANIPYQAFDLGCEHPIPDSEYQSLLTPLDEFKINRYSDIIGMFVLPPLPTMRCRQSRIGYWEFESGLLERYPEFGEPGTLIANSKFDEFAFTQQLPQCVHVKHILYPFQFTSSNITPRDEVRLKYGIGVNDFMVFFNFDFNSGYYRKNPEGVVHAFKKAFSSHSDTKLVFKTMGVKKKPEFVQRLKAAIHDANLDDRVIFIDRFIPQEELVGLTNACDAYLSLHRGEGFGLGIAEAMSLGKPVVVTNYSAPTEFCNAENSMLVPWKLISVPPEEIDNPNYRFVQTWAEPDIDAAAEALRRLYEEPELRKRIGENAKRFIAEYFSIENFKKSINKFLDSSSSLETV